MNENRGLWRAKRKDNGEWIEGSPYDRFMICGMDLTFGDEEVPMSEYPEFDWVEIIPETLGECTGQLDKKGRLAFEGDLIKNHFGDGLGVIRYEEYKNPFNDDRFTKHIGFYVDWLEENDKYSLRKDLGYWLSIVEIIGNIQDNPQLLEASTGEDIGNAAQDTLLPAT